MKQHLIWILLLILPRICYSQIDSIYGAYITVTIGNSPLINLYPNNTFAYKAQFCIGGSPETMGTFKMFHDTIYFLNNDQIYPVVKNITKKVGGDTSYIKISIRSYGDHNYCTLIGIDSINEPHHLYAFNDLGELYLSRLLFDSIYSKKSLEIQPYMNSGIPIHLDLTNFNEFEYEIELPVAPTAYYLTAEKAIVKNGLLYLSPSVNSIPYYNTSVYKNKRSVRKIEKFIWEKRMKLLKENLR